MSYQDHAQATDLEPPPRLDAAPRRALSAEEIQALLTACRDGSNCGTRDLALLVLMVSTGLRRAEASALELDDVDGDRVLVRRRNVVIISAYYGVPGALQVYGNPNLVPDAVSPQLSAFYWLPNNVTTTDALMVDYRPSDVQWMCTAPTLIAHLTVPYQVVGLEQGAPVTLCHLKAPIPKIWGRLRNFS